MKTFFILSALVWSVAAASAQDLTGLWHRAGADITHELGPPALPGRSFAAYTVSESALQGFLATAPADPDRAIRMALPAPDGTCRTFRLWATPVLAPELAEKYPGIATYTAVLEANHRVTAKIDYTTHGFHAVVFDGAGTYLVNPYRNRPAGVYSASYKHQIDRPDGAYMSCGVGDRPDRLPAGAKPAARTNGSTRKMYRLAISCTGEYAVAVDGPSPTKAGVLSAMVTTVNRVNGVYERELAVSMTLIANYDAVIYLDAATDPYSSNTSAFSLLNENQSNMNLVLGAAGFDIGHVFSTGAGGLAEVGIVCQADKARGVTGSASPVGDFYDIDYVAHEIGHQFGANHTFNGSEGSCSGNGEPPTAFEPGSGSTLMAYAGICGGTNLQAHSDDYFHSASLEEISTYITTDAGANCAVMLPSPNGAASLGGFDTSFTIPSGTPFELTAPPAEDGTADTAINYCWEERDLGNFGGSFFSTTIRGPIFRSFRPDTSRTRIFPALAKLLAGVTNYNGEKLPTYSRTLRFGLTVRDLYQGWGAFNFPDDRISLHVEAMDPFRVTYPQGDEVWTGGRIQKVAWDVSGTAAAPVSCSRVDIYLSTDGGYTFPYLLKAGTRNDGSELVLLPNISSDYVRIKVKGSDNVFFALSAADSYLIIDTVTTPVPADVTVGPNPARGRLQVNIPPSQGSLEARLVNMIGQTVWTATLSGNQTLDASVWPRGIYHMTLRGEGGFLQTHKLVFE